MQTALTLEWRNKLVNPEEQHLIAGIRSLVNQLVAKGLSGAGWDINIKFLLSGKMLRSRLGIRLLANRSALLDRSALQAIFAATELVHTVSLCHDDVVDNSLIRRSQPTLWRVTGPSAAILIGDLLLCEATKLLTETQNGRYLNSFIVKVREVITAEVEQELLYRGKWVDEETCLRLARGKTGPLFAFVSGVCGGDDETLSSLLEEAGYRIGTAYQLADDLLDVVGSEEVSGKTLGTDVMRRKFTLAQSGEQGLRVTRQHVRRLCASAIDLVEAYGDVQSAMKQFLRDDLQPVLEGHLRTSMELTA